MPIACDNDPEHGPEEGFPAEGPTQLVRPVVHAVDIRFVADQRDVVDGEPALDRALARIAQYRKDLR